MKNRVEEPRALILFDRLSYFIHIVHDFHSENCPEDNHGNNVDPSHTSLLYVTLGPREAIFGGFSVHMSGECSHASILSTFGIFA